MTPRPPPAFTHDAFLSHRAKDKAEGHPRPEAASRQSAAFSSERQTWEKKDGGALPRRRYAAKIKAGLEHARGLGLCLSVNAFGSDWAQLEAGTFRFRDPLNQERRLGYGAR